jgi:hypothetical protein
MDPTVPTGWTVLLIDGDVVANAGWRGSYLDGLANSEIALS